MKVQVINKLGQQWIFSSMNKAKPFIKKFASYTNKREGKEKIRIYDDRVKE